MDFTLTCECGSPVIVSEGAAGAMVACRCGQPIRVPSLAQLRIQAGLPAVAVAPEARIAAMVADGDLPGSRCATCGSVCESHLSFVAMCEREHRTGPGRHEWITYLLPFGYLFRSEQRETVFHGRETIVPLPLALCPACRSSYLPGRLPQVAKVVAFLLLVAGVVLVWVRGSAALAVLGCAVSAYFIAVVSARRARACIRRLLGTVPEYQELLSRFPDATVIRARGS